ncbi:MAG: hypothetical protein P8P29_05825 [Flavobacteriaceae bacterium]|nr:hypothetical protein [Flavobacteriaceae bacterium]
MNTKTRQILVKEKLEIIIQNEPHTIKARVAKEALGYTSESIVNFFDDLFRYGCISGMVTSLVYYIDTHKFYDLHYNQIEGIREIYEEFTDYPLVIQGDLKNFLAWFAFEQTAYQLANELGLEI